MKIKKNDISKIFNIIFCIASKDGIISDLEVKKAQSEFSKIFNMEISDKEMDINLDLYFSSDYNFEDHLGKIADKEMRIQILRLGRISASADGLHIIENIAIDKALIIWSLDRGDIDD